MNPSKESKYRTLFGDNCDSAFEMINEIYYYISNGIIILISTAGIVLASILL